MDDDNSPSVDRQAKRSLSRAVQFDTQIKDLDVSQPPRFMSMRLLPPLLNVFLPEQAARTPG